MASPGFQKSKRSWQEIAAEAFVEKDPAKLERLADELAEALYERDKARAAKSACKLSLALARTHAHRAAKIKCPSE